MKRTCEVCFHTFDISEIYVGRRQRNWPKCMCKQCRTKFPSFNENKYTQGSLKNPKDILLNAGYPMDFALTILDQGL